MFVAYGKIRFQMMFAAYGKVRFQVLFASYGKVRSISSAVCCLWKSKIDFKCCLLPMVK